MFVLMFVESQGQEPFLCQSTAESPNSVAGWTRLFEGGTKPNARGEGARVITRGTVPFTCVYISGPLLQKHKLSADQLSAKMKCVSRNSLKAMTQFIKC